MNPYSILGIDSSATKEEAKKAYKKLSMKHHPDRKGGDAEKFKEITAAYELIKSGKATAKPTGRTSGFNGTEFNFSKDDLDDILRRKVDFSEILRNAKYQHQMQVSITAQLPLKNAVLGGEQIMQVPVHGKTETVKVQIPEGLMDGEKLRYPKLVNGVDIVVTYKIIPDPDWEVTKLDLIKKQSISIWTLITGGSLDVKLINGTTVRLRIPPKTQPGTQMRVTGKGILSRINGTSRGDMLVRLDAKIPEDIPAELLAQIGQAQLNI